MAVVAAFADVDVAAFLLQGRIRSHSLDAVRFGVDPGKGQHHGDDSADENGASRQNDKEDRFLLPHDQALPSAVAVVTAVGSPFLTVM